MPNPLPLSKDEYQALHHVRKELWSQGAYGLLVGASSGLVLHTALSLLHRHVRPLPFLKLNRNTAMTSFFLGGAMGSFLLATAAGKNQVHRLHPIFPARKGDATNKEAASYERTREAALHEAFLQDEERTQISLEQRK
jgi:hypothetical protein